MERIWFQMLGFDLRVPPGAGRPRGCWDMFLLRNDVPYPLSTDEAVWEPSIDWDEAGAPQWRGPFQNLWENLDELESWLAKHPHQLTGPAWLVAFGRMILAEEAQGLEGTDAYTSILYESTYPATADAAWELLGYDVGDYFQLSGLSNCGYTSEDARKEQFGKLLNDHHLFTTFEDAEAFAQWTDDRVPEHAPFFVHPIWKVRELTAPLL